MLVDIQATKREFAGRTTCNQQNQYFQQQQQKMFCGRNFIDIDTLAGDGRGMGRGGRTLYIVW